MVKLLIVESAVKYGPGNLKISPQKVDYLSQPNEQILNLMISPRDSNITYVVQLDNGAEEIITILNNLTNRQSPVQSVTFKGNHATSR